MNDDGYYVPMSPADLAALEYTEDDERDGYGYEYD